MVAPLQDTEQAMHFAAVIARTGLDPWDGHVAAVADTSVCPVVTLDADKWREHARDLDEPLYFVEIADPDDMADRQNDAHVRNSLSPSASANRGPKCPAGA